MSEFFTFASDSPVLAFILICSCYYLLSTIFVRGYRTIKVLARGWPPAHLDADGDWKPEPEKEEK